MRAKYSRSDHKSRSGFVNNESHDTDEKAAERVHRSSSSKGVSVPEVVNNENRPKIDWEIPKITADFPNRKQNLMMIATIHGFRTITFYWSLTPQLALSVRG